MAKKLTPEEQKIKSLTTIQEFEDIMNNLLFSNRQKQIFQLYYGNQLNMLEIGLEIGYSTLTVSKELNIIRNKLSNYNFSDK